MFTKLRYLTSGESHGKGLLGILDGIPAGLEISEREIRLELARRQRGYGRGARMKIEIDFAEIWGGVRHGKTIGAPIGLLLKNKDWDNWQNKMDIKPNKKPGKKVTLPRPGHADLAGMQKYDFDDIRNVLERSSARETAMRVALGSVCKKLLHDIGIKIGSHVTQIYKVRSDLELDYYSCPESISENADNSPVRCLDLDKEKDMIKVIDKAKSDGDSVGGVFEVIVSGLPYGLGSHVQWDKKLHSRIAQSMMSVNAFKGIEVGSGFSQAEKFGSEVHDEIGFDGMKFTRSSNNCGGMEGGMSNGQPLIIKSVMKPIPTLIKPLKSVDFFSKEKKLAHKERTDSCAVPAASIVAESMVCFVIVDAVLEKFGGDTMDQLKSHIKISGKY
ncbi:MAG: chorismate synthase [Candidatus Marinimicrobia bacterium]|nr:chorismate synthase [Candidatus Neomarinimicrobiota bacterium]